MARYFMWLGIVLGLISLIGESLGMALIFFTMAALNYHWSQDKDEAP